MVGFKGSTQEKSIFEIFRFRLKKSPHDKKVPDRIGSGLCLAVVMPFSMNCLKLRR